MAGKRLLKTPLEFNFYSEIQPLHVGDPNILHYLRHNAPQVFNLRPQGRRRERLHLSPLPHAALPGTNHHYEKQQEKVFKALRGYHTQRKHKWRYHDLTTFDEPIPIKPIRHRPCYPADGLSLSRIPRSSRSPATRATSSLMPLHKTA